MTSAIESVVVIVDADDRSRTELVQDCQQSGLTTRAYVSPEGFLRDLAFQDRPMCFCVVTEMRFSEMSGLDLLDRLRATPHTWSAIFLGRAPKVRDVVRLMRAGAIAVVDREDGLGALQGFVEEGVEVSRSRYLNEQSRYHAMEQFQQLTSGEQLVLRGIMNGKLNKEIAQELSLSIRTIEQRRREVFRKLGVQHPASLACKIMEIAGPRPNGGTTEAETSNWLEEARRRSESLQHRPHSRLDRPHASGVDDRRDGNKRREI